MVTRTLFYHPKGQSNEEKDKYKHTRAKIVPDGADRGVIQHQNLYFVPFVFREWSMTFQHCHVLGNVLGSHAYICLIFKCHWPLSWCTVEFSSHFCKLINGSDIFQRRLVSLIVKIKVLVRNSIVTLESRMIDIFINFMSRTFFISAVNFFFSNFNSNPRTKFKI